MAQLRNRKPRPSARPSVAGQLQTADGENSARQGTETLITRRRLLYGAIGLGAVAAIGAGAAAYSSSTDEEEVSYLDAPASSLTTLGDLEALENPEEHVRLIGQFDLPYGSLVWANDDSIAACLLPTETGSPLTQLGILALDSGNVTTVLEKAIGAEEGFEIYDVRATDSGLIWTEANILQGDWRVYGASLSRDELGKPVLLEENNDLYDMPTLAIAGNRAFWQVLPKETGADRPPSRLMGATLGRDDAAIVFESSRRMGTPPYCDANSVTIAARVDSPSLYYQLTNLDAKTGEVRDSLTLPHSVSPIECGYGDTGFMFSFPDIYDLNGAIANLGTYAPRSKPPNGNYDAAEWFDFTRTPTAAPAWCDGLLIVKSTYSVCGIDLDAGTYFAIDVENGADTYGEYLASTGSRDAFVTFTNIDHTPIGAERIHTCRVKVWTTLG